MGGKEKLRDGRLIYQIPLFHSILQRTISAQLMHQYHISSFSWEIEILFFDEISLGASLSY